jgi:hypothetical protein
MNDIYAKEIKIDKNRYHHDDGIEYHQFYYSHSTRNDPYGREHSRLSNNFIMPESRHTRAEKLFLQHLTPSQIETYTEENYIDIVSNKKHKYRINTISHSLNIHRMDGLFIVRRRFCIQLTNYSCPIHDHLLAQKLLIETNENHFLKIAYRTT